MGGGIPCVDRGGERFGPVRAVHAEPQNGFVLEVAFEGIALSNRHKSGVAMRFPRIARLRMDKPLIEADRLETLMGVGGWRGEGVMQIGRPYADA